MSDFGRDISCTTSLRTGRYVTGSRIVAEAVYRRLTTPRGMLLGDEDEEDYGLDLTELIGSVATKNDAAALEGRIASELEKDERIDVVSASVTPIVDGPSTEFEILIEGRTIEDEAFDLTIAVTDVSVELLNINTET